MENKINESVLKETLTTLISIVYLLKGNLFIRVIHLKTD